MSRLFVLLALIPSIDGLRPATAAPRALAAACVKPCRGVLRAYQHHFPWSPGTVWSNDLCSYEIDSTRLFA